MKKEQIKQTREIFFRALEGFDNARTERDKRVARATIDNVRRMVGSDLPNIWSTEHYLESYYS